MSTDRDMSHIPHQPLGIRCQLPGRLIVRYCYFKKQMKLFLLNVIVTDLMMAELSGGTFKQSSEQSSCYYFLNIFYSGIEYTEKDWVRLKSRHCPIQTW